MSFQDLCVLCHTVEHETLTNKLRFEKPGVVVKCIQCGLVRIKNAIGYEEKLNNYYAEQYATEYHLGVKKDLDTLYDTFLPVQESRVEKIKPYIKNGDRVLEIGSSVGYFLNSIRPFAGQVQGQELNKAEAAYAQTAKNIPTSTIPIERSDLPQGYYDHICLFQVLEHMAEPMKFLATVKKFLSPQGKIHIEVPNLMDPLVWLYDIEEYRNFYYQEPHLHYFSLETLTKICEKSGFKVDAAYGFQQTSLLNNLNWLLTKKPQKSRWDCIQATLAENSFRKEISPIIKQDFQELLEKFNSMYLEFLTGHGFGDMLFATISKD